MIRIIRPVNLGILALTQLVVYYLFIAPYHHTVNIELFLGDKNLFLLILVGILITVAGYLINDYYDYEIDKQKKGKKQFQNRSKYITYYALIHLTGFSFAVYLALEYEKIQLSVLYLAAALLLHLYSFKLKSSVLWGNLLVSFFTAMSFGILLIAEWSSITQLKSEAPALYKELMSGMIAFMIFCFLINLSRELMKDVEDMEDDARYGIVTYPIKFGVARSKTLCLFFLSLLLFSIIIWSVLNWKLNTVILSLAFLILPCLILIFKTIRSFSNSDFRSLSRLSKLNMLFALIYLILA